MDRFYVVCRQIILNQPFFISGEVFAGGGYNERRLSESGQTVCDISGCPSEFFDESVYVEADVQDVDLVGQDVIGKMTGKIHYAIISQRPGNKYVHGTLLFF